MKLSPDQRLPNNDDIPALKTRLSEIFRNLATQLNGVSEGRLSAFHNSYTAAPTTGTWAKGDFIKNSSPTAPTPTIGWICTTAGTPGTWTAVTVGGGGGGGTTCHFGTATLNFGAAPGSNEASVAVADAAILGTSKVEAYIMADDTSASHTASDHRYIAAILGLTCGTPSAGVGFTLYGRCMDKLTGTVSVRYMWAD